MSMRKAFKRFQRAAARYALFSCEWLFKHLPYGAVRWFTNVLLKIAFAGVIRQRRIAEETVEIAFGAEKSREEKRRIVKKCFESFGRGMVEMLYFMAHPKALEGKAVFEGRDHLDAALAKGKGVIAVTAHFGNFPLMMLTCACEGYHTSSIIRPTRDEVLSAYLQKRRDEVGLGTIYAIPRRQCVLNSLKILRENGLLFIPIDQNFGGDGGIYVDFFGRKAATATGPAVLAMRTGAVILPMFIVRESQDTHKIIIEPPMLLEEGTDEKEVVAGTMGRITGLIERYIRRYPYEWAWMHRRWKSRPSEGAATGEEAFEVEGAGRQGP